MLLSRGAVLPLLHASIHTELLLEDEHVMVLVLVDADLLGRLNVEVDALCFGKGWILKQLRLIIDCVLRSKNSPARRVFNGCFVRFAWCLQGLILRLVSHLFLEGLHLNLSKRLKSARRVHLRVD